MTTPSISCSRDLMGGFVVSIAWDGSPDHGRFEAAASGMANRGPAGVTTMLDPIAAMAEARTHRDGPAGWAIATLGRLSLVGDLRLWNTADLRRHAPADCDDPRMLVLHGYAAMGPEVMEVVDGDFAFVIWDSASHRAFAARDRFGVKPLWVRRTTRGIDLASDVRQLVAMADEPIPPDDVTVARFLSDTIPYDARSFHAGVERLMPAHVLTADTQAVATTPYWDPAAVDEQPIDATDVAPEFRRHLIDAVRRRLATATRTVSQLSGGLDSSTIAASAHALVSEGLDSRAFTTVSATVPGNETDETAWIEETVASQPFGHRSFTPRNWPH